MPSASQDVDLLQDQPIALEDLLGLAPGKKYLISNAGETVVLARSSATEPAPDARGHLVAPIAQGDIVAIADDTFKSWFWSRDPDGGRLVITEIPS